MKLISCFFLTASVESFKHLGSSSVIGLTKSISSSNALGSLTGLHGALSSSAEGSMSPDIRSNIQDQDQEQEQEPVILMKESSLTPPTLNGHGGQDKGDDTCNYSLADTSC